MAPWLTFRDEDFSWALAPLPKHELSSIHVSVGVRAPENICVPRDLPYSAENTVRDDLANQEGSDPGKKD
jgi:hypothetical protein